MDARAWFRGSKACADVLPRVTRAVIGVTLTLAEGRAIPVDARAWFNCPEPYAGVHPRLTSEIVGCAADARAGFGRPEPYAVVHPSVNDVDGG